MKEDSDDISIEKGITESMSLAVAVAYEQFGYFS